MLEINPYSPDRECPLNIWPLLTGSDVTVRPQDIDGLRIAAGKLSQLISPVLTDYLLNGVSGTGATGLFDSAALQRDRLIKRFTLAQHRHWAQAIVTAGLDVVFIKGFANAHTVYPDPALRIQGDLDVLVRPADCADLVNFLIAQGFSCQEPENNPWGMISDSSFLPFVSADGASHIDIHIHPDSYPAHRSLTTELVFADSRQVAVEDVNLRMPSNDHSLILCVTNAAKDKFNISSVGKVIDAIMLLQHGDQIHWDRVSNLAEKGGYLLPTRAFFALLDALGIAMGNMPRTLCSPPEGLRGVAFRQVLDDYRAYFPQDLPMTALLWREIMICAEPIVALQKTCLRLKGLLRPSKGMYENVPVMPNGPLTDFSKSET